MTKMTPAAKRKAKNNVNEFLAAMGRVYQDGIPVSAIADKLHSEGFVETADLNGIYCGHDGRIEPTHVGEGVYLALSWHKMPSNRYEITSYLS